MVSKQNVKYTVYHNVRDTVFMEQHQVLTFTQVNTNPKADESINIIIDS